MWVLSALLTGVAAAGTPPLGARFLDIPPRYMWGWEEFASGYCGSVSVQTAGIYYGNWLTEDYVRGTSGGHDPDHQILLGASNSTSAIHACKKLRLDCAAWDHDRAPRPQHEAFLRWARAGIDAGWPVVLGVFWSRDADHIDLDYDHIVPMVGYDNTAIFINDLRRNHTLRLEEADFVRSREGCNEAGSPEWCLPSAVDYGIRVRGNADTEGVLLPIRMAVSSWTEPDYGREDRQQEKPTSLPAELTISGLDEGARYALLRYDDPDMVPDRSFLESRFREKTVFVAAGKSHKYNVTFMSNSTTLFRCVLAGEGIVV